MASRQPGKAAGGQLRRSAGKAAHAAAEQAVPDMQFVDTQTFNGLVSEHAALMIFLFIIPAFAGLANFAVPLMLGAPDMAFPRLNALSFWLLPSAGLIMHSDRGSQYASDEHRQLLKDYRMIQSMSRRASCWDNAAIESFFKTLKVERVYQLRYDTRAEARLDILDWIEGFYNRRRMHSSIGYQTPVDAELNICAA